MEAKSTYFGHYKYALLILPLLTLQMFALGQELLDPVTHPKFVNPLPVPQRIDLTENLKLEMEMAETTQWLGLYNNPSDLNPLMTTVWGYGTLGSVSSPGPTLVAESYVPADIKWYNNLPSNGHLLPVDPTMHMAHPMDLETPEEIEAFYEHHLPTVVHLHGGHTESASDGLPEAWWTQNWEYTGPQHVKETYTYHNSQEAATLWYHDHALGITRLNVYAGLAGFYLLKDNNEALLKAKGVLPKELHEFEIVIQDRDFYDNGELYLPAFAGDSYFDGKLTLPGDSEVEEDGITVQPDDDTMDWPENRPTHVAEFFGNFIMVNGMMWPYLEVEPRKYRFRLLNGSDSRVYRLAFDNIDNFLQIGTDVGLLPYPVEISELIIAPGERADLIVDFSDLEDEVLQLQNTGPDEPFKGSNWNDDVTRPTGKIMQFRVNQKLKGGKGKGLTASVNTGTMLHSSLPPITNPEKTRQLVLFEGSDEYGRLQPLLGVYSEDESENLGSLGWFEPITENPDLNAVETWEVINVTEDAHPIHLHLVAFQIINREKLAVDIEDLKDIVDSKPQLQHNGQLGDGGILNDLPLSGVVEAPAANEKGWKDTFVVPPGYVGRVQAKFDLPGRYVWHCHILSHEDHEMMRPFHVGPLPMDPAEIIQTASLSQNTPNPFSENTTITFTLEKPQPVSIIIFDQMGNKVFSLQNRILNKGNHKIFWDGANDQKQILPEGLYYYTLNAGDFTESKRMVIVR